MGCSVPHPTLCLQSGGRNKSALRSGGRSGNEPAGLQSQRSLDVSVTDVSLSGLEDLSTSTNELLGGQILHTARAGETGGVAGHWAVQPVGVGPCLEVNRSASTHDCDDDESVFLVLLVPLFQSGGASRAAASTKSCMLEQDDVIAEVVDLQVLTVLVHQRNVADDLALAP